MGIGIMTKDKSRRVLLIPFVQGMGFLMMGLYFWYDAELQFHEAGPGPFIAILGFVEASFSLYAWKTDL
jgi:hypothetical protein